MRVNRTLANRRTATCVALTALLAASLVGSAQAVYKCTSDGQCKYPSCNGYCGYYVQCGGYGGVSTLREGVVCARGARGGWNGEERGGTRSRVVRACVRAVAVHRLVLTLWLLMMMGWDLRLLSHGLGGGLSVHSFCCHL
jgi:hypothetical protein